MHMQLRCIFAKKHKGVNQMKRIAKTLLLTLLVVSLLMPLTAFAFSQPKYARGDVNGDGKITSQDARIALWYCVGLVILTE